MQPINFRFAFDSVDYFFDSSILEINQITHSGNLIFLTDENVYAAHSPFFKDKKTIIIKAGEINKTQYSVDKIIDQLIFMEADRNAVLIGVGGGVVTDITGFVASIFKRGVSFGLVPSTLLAMVDAAIGGKNGINVGKYKNLAGTIRQPSFILFDSALLKTLPQQEWINGFAEIIKHAAINDLAMFQELENNAPVFYQENAAALAELVKKNVLLKTAIVQQDEFEKGKRKLLNLGHTLGHAIENLYQLPHGYAVSIGMAFAAELSEKFIGFKNSSRLKKLLQQYQLPVSCHFNLENAMEVLRKDKKKSGDFIHFVLLKEIGEAVIRETSIIDIRKALTAFH